MSFSLEFRAVSKKAALEQVAKAYLPEAVRELLRTSIELLKPADEDHPRTIFVKANGHLHTGSDYDRSTVDLVVSPEPLVG